MCNSTLDLYLRGFVTESSDDYETPDEDDLYKEIGPPIPGRVNFNMFAILIH